MRFRNGILLSVALLAACGGETSLPSESAEPGQQPAPSELAAPSTVVVPSMPASSGRAGTSSPVPASAGGAGVLAMPASAGVVAASSDGAGALAMPASAGVVAASAGAGGASEVVGAAGSAGGDAAAAAGSGGGAQASPSEKPTGPLFPAPGASNVCTDLSLHLRFDSKPSLGSGKISVFEQGSTTAIASVEVSTARMTVTPNGTDLVFVQPAFVVDRELIVRLPAALEYGKSYYVKVDAAAVRATGGALPANETDWTFRTRAAPPADVSQLRVAQDGTGDFCSVQAALAAAASGATISVGQGYYHELVHVREKSGVTLRGDDRKGTVILGVNNDSLNAGTAKRALVNIEKSSDLIIERLTIHNLTEQGGSQAEALRLQDCDKCVVRDADILSLQDTLLWNGRIYARDLYVAGNVDFIWGKGAVFFERSEIKTVGRKGYVVQSRNTPEGYGYVFVDSKISADAGLTGIVLARIDASEYPGSHVAFIDCEMGRHIAPEGWTITGSAGSALRFWEYQSKGEGGAPLDVSRRHPSSKQISAEQAAIMRDPAQVLGGWAPPR